MRKRAHLELPNDTRDAREFRPGLAFDGGRLRFLYLELVNGGQQWSAIVKLFLAYFWLEDRDAF
jgi:hypothetical protein